MKKIFYALAAMVPAMAAMAIIPGEETPGRDSRPATTDNPANVLMKADGGYTNNQNSFLEGFEGRDPDGYGFIANAWLPSGWSQFSRAGNRHMKSDDGFWDLTWLTLSNESVGHLPAEFQTASYEGDSFAYIMPDVMWGSKPPYPDLDLDEASLHPQDEWLVSPTLTPVDEEWLYFQLQYRPGWCLYNRDTNDFSGETNLLEVYVTEGDGTTDSDWKLLWSLKDRIHERYTDEQLRADLSTLDGSDYEEIFVNVKDYVEKNVKFGFRFYGVGGKGMALDNIAIGVPYPKPHYEIPSGFLKQQSLTPEMKEITGTPQLLIPYSTEALWKNTSKDILSQEWSYDSADGTRLNTENFDLTTPAYEYGKTYTAPELKGIFESRSSVYTTPYCSMQAGGRLHGTGQNGYEGEMGVATYDYLDPEGSLVQSSSHIAFHNGMHEAWETILGRLPNTIEIHGIGCVYAATPVAYGFDYVDVFAQIPTEAGLLDPETRIELNVYRLPENEYEDKATLIGHSMLTGAEINALPDLEPGYFYKNLRFRLDVPAVADGNLLVMLAPDNIVGDDIIVFPYMKSNDSNVWGTSVVYMYVYESEENGGTYDTFYNLNNFQLSKGHFAGLTMTLGAAYSHMELPTYDGKVIDLPYTGGTYEMDIRSSMAPENWGVTTNGATAADWISLSAKADEIDPELYHVTFEFKTNMSGDERRVEATLRQAGAQATFKVKQAGNPASISEISSPEGMNVEVTANAIVIDNAYGEVGLYGISGVRIASAYANGKVEISRRHLPKGVYVVRAGKSAFKVVL